MNTRPEQQEAMPPALLDPSTQAGLEVAPASETDKQSANGLEEGDKVVINQEWKEVVQSDRAFGEPMRSLQRPTLAGTPSTTNPRICGMRRKLFWVFATMLILVVALAVGLGVGLASGSSSEPSATSPAPDTTSSSTLEPSAIPTGSEPLQIGGSIDPSFYSRSGAWNGSGVAHIWQNLSQDLDGLPTTTHHSNVVYFQRYSGEIRWMRMKSDTQWVEGPQSSLVVATDVRNSTPISGVQYMLNGTSYWNVFYIDSDNLVRQRSGNSENTTEGWTEGSIYRAGLRAWGADLVGLKACWSSINTSVPIRLFYASNATTIQEYLWWADEDNWVWQNSWNDYDGAANVGCRDGDGSNTHLGLVTLNNQIEFWYQRTAGDDLSNWQEAAFKVDGVQSASSISLTADYIVFQDNSTNQMRVVGVTWGGNNTRSSDLDISPAPTFSGLPATRMDAVQILSVLWIFYQRVGDDVAWLSRSDVDRRWVANTPVPISW